ncbi:hypothetical protein EV702DRAFT_1043961 [Suillus placidus]|uniref:Uncharacterized protein n=1 Tax=Suillus placidus TaxID=48579 RepID=A0A9P7D569_9AGAM|nr:hypothetical protein EV702DRAFT_1043961 [Suillus placidus]
MIRSVIVLVLGAVKIDINGSRMRPSNFVIDTPNCLQPPSLTNALCETILWRKHYSEVVYLQFSGTRYSSSIAEALRGTLTQTFSCRISSPTIFLGFEIPRTPFGVELCPGKNIPRSSRGCYLTPSWLRQNAAINLSFLCPGNLLTLASTIAEEHPNFEKDRRVQQNDATTYNKYCGAASLRVSSDRVAAGFTNAATGVVPVIPRWSIIQIAVQTSMHFSNSPCLRNDSSTALNTAPDGVFSILRRRAKKVEVCTAASACGRRHYNELELERDEALAVSQHLVDIAIMKSLSEMIIEILVPLYKYTT